jgi:predicted DNA binding CopG/RHH family protein
MKTKNKVKKLSAKQIEASAKKWVNVSEKNLARVNAVFKEAITKEKKEAKFTARLNQNDFDGLRAIANDFGLGYQTLLGLIVHRYVTGKLVDVDEVKKILPEFKRASGE